MSFHYSRLMFTLQFSGSGGLPEHKTSALRGGMGQMLLRMFCVVPQKQESECEGCICRDHCIVQNIMYAKYKIKPDFVTTGESAGFEIFCNDHSVKAHQGQNIEFEMVLFSDTVAFFYPILQAIHMLGTQGLGYDRVKFKVISVVNSLGGYIVDGFEVLNQNIIIENSDKYIEIKRNELGISVGWHNVHIDFFSPCTIKHQGKMIHDFSPNAVMNAIVRRLYMASLFEGIDVEQINMSEYNCKYDRQSKETFVKRQSGRKNEKVTLKGITGYMNMYEIGDDIVDILIEGELVGIGKNVRFGFGRYRVEML